MAPTLSINPCLWDFSLHYYARAGVSRVCLQLQDEHGVNVNLLLWTLWLGYRGIQLQPAQLSLVQRKIHSWDQHYVLPLRQLRRRMKVEFGSDEPGVETVRTQIKQAELLAEKHLQQLLESHTLEDKTMIPSARSDTLMAKNLRLYLHLFAVNETFINELLELIY